MLRSQYPKLNGNEVHIQIGARVRTPLFTLPSFLERFYKQPSTFSFVTPQSHKVLKPSGTQCKT